jgi:hypothetical protein
MRSPAPVIAPPERLRERQPNLPPFKGRTSDAGAAVESPILDTVRKFGQGGFSIPARLRVVLV